MFCVIKRQKRQIKDKKTPLVTYLWNRGMKFLVQDSRSNDHFKVVVVSSYMEMDAIINPG